MAQTIKRLPAIRETCVRSLGQEDPLEKEMATHSSILAWKIPWVEEPSGLQSMGLQRVGHDLATSLIFTLTCETDLQKHCYNLCQRMFCSCCLLGVLWCHVLYLNL